MFFLLKKREWRIYLIALLIISIYPLINVYINKTKPERINTPVAKVENSQVAFPDETQNVLAEKIEVTVMPTKKQEVNREVKLGISSEDYTRADGSIPSLEKQLGITFNTVSIYKQFGHPTNKYVSEEDLSYLKSTVKNLLIAWEPWNPLEGGSQSVDYLQQIPKGSTDEYIKAFAAQLKSFSKPVIIRFGHEMNGNWYPWGGRPEEYKTAYRYMVDMLRKEGLTNVKFMWSINAENVPLTRIANVSKFYPGEAYVDMIGIDGYNWGGSNWRSFKDIFSSPYNYLNKTYNKPIIISETASSEIGGSKAAWIAAMFAALKSDYPKISEVVWFNIPKEQDWRIDSSQSSLEAFKSSF